MSVIGDCEERIQKEAYQRGYEEGAKAEREKWRDGHPDDLVWMVSEEEEKRIRKDERERALKEIFSPMDTFFGNIPIDEHIITWAVSKQDSFVTAAMASYMAYRKSLRHGQKQERAPE